MDRADLAPLSAEVLLPGGGFDEAPFPVDPRAAARTAIRERPAVRRRALEIEDASLREAVAGNGELPALDLFGAVAVRGLDDSLGKGLGHGVREGFFGWTAGLAFEIPLGNRAARAALHEARLRRDSSFLRYEETVRAVVEDVRDAVRDMEAARDLATAARTFRLTQAESLRRLLEEERRRAALTPEFLSLKLSREERLAQARLQEVAALADFHRARAAWRRAQGALPAAAAAPPEEPRPPEPPRVRPVDRPR
jgi:outer membrane protein TolC